MCNSECCQSSDGLFKRGTNRMLSYMKSYFSAKTLFYRCSYSINSRHIHENRQMSWFSNCISKLANIISIYTDVARKNYWERCASWLIIILITFVWNVVSNCNCLIKHVLYRQYLFLNTFSTSSLNTLVLCISLNRLS